MACIMQTRQKYSSELINQVKGSTNCLYTLCLKKTGPYNNLEQPDKNRPIINNFCIVCG